MKRTLKIGLSFTVLIIILVICCSCSNNQKLKYGAYVCPDGFGSEFSIVIKDDGTFNYYEGLLSSVIGRCNYEYKDGKVVLNNYGNKTYSFEYKNNKLVFIKNESDRFTYVDLMDKSEFVYDTTYKNTWYVE